MLRLEAATFQYAAGAALGPFSLSVASGELVVLLGPNGSGKTTALKLLSGTHAPRDGRATWNGEDLSSMTPHRRANVLAMVPQRLHVAFDLTVEDLVAMGRLHRQGWRERLRPLGRDDRRAVDESLQACDLDGFQRRSFQDLSGGEQQRVLLALALSQDTPVLLLDEPTASLDPGHAQHFMALVAGLAAAGHHVVMSHHDLSLAAQYATSVHLLKGGREVAAGPPDEILTAARLSDVYEASLFTLPHPDTGRPIVVPRFPGGGSPSPS